MPTYYQVVSNSRIKKPAKVLLTTQDYDEAKKAMLQARKTEPVGRRVTIRTARKGGGGNAPVTV